MRIFLLWLIVSLFVLGGSSIVTAEGDKAETETAKGNAFPDGILFEGMKFGAGIMANFYPGGKKPVESASVVNGVVRVDEENKAQVGVVAEIHTLWPFKTKRDFPYLFYCEDAEADKAAAEADKVAKTKADEAAKAAGNADAKAKADEAAKAAKAAKAKADEAAKAAKAEADVGIGLAMGLNLGNNNIIDGIFLGPMLAFRPDTKSSQSFNLAIGAVMAPKVKVLGDGIEEGKPLPEGETEVRFKKENKFGYAILLSFAW